MSWIYKKVELKDSDTILKWRNNPEIYKYLFNPHPIDPIDHNNWFTKIIVNKSVLFLIAEFNSAQVGTVRFDFTENFNEAEVGIYLAPEMHGLGLGSPMLLGAEQVARENYPLLRKIIAKVLVENRASGRMFEKSYYKNIGLQKNYIEFEKLLED